MGRRMIEKIFIPTVNRVDNQITYNGLSKSLKKKVVMVVQAWERPKYNYDCDYFVLPDIPEYHFSDYFCCSRTKAAIYDAAKDMKYCVFDDDITFYKRNSKYVGEASDMEKSRMQIFDDDLNRMFDMFDSWLDESEVTVCGCSQIQNPPSGVKFRNNASLTSALWINGKDFKNVLPELDLISVRCGEDVAFLLSLLTRGYGNRVSDEYAILNASVSVKKMKSDIWDQQTVDQTLEDHKRLEKMFPEVYSILYDEEGKRVGGGYRDHGKSKIEWSKAYKLSKKISQNTLESFFE